jgi:GNAT superfamily N-acetyltransferase
VSDAAFEIVPYEPGRRDDFLALMREVYEGTSWSEEEFDWWFEQNPTGHFILNLADEDGSTIGAAAQSYARMVIGGLEGEATFTVHVMTSAAARGKGAFSALQLHNDEQAARAGARLALGFTNPMAGPIFVGKLGWDELCWLRLWVRPKRPLRAVRHLRARGHPLGGVHGPLEEFGARHEEIYRRAAATWADHLVKDAAYLNCELVGGDGLRLLNRCARLVDADLMLAMPNLGEYRTYLAAGFVPTPSAIRFIGRSLQPDQPLPRGRNAFRLSLGDTDIF